MNMRLTVQGDCIRLPEGIHVTDGTEAEVTLRIASPSPGSEEDRARRITAIWKAIRERNPFKEIDDPVKWQREMREDRPLPWRD